MVLRADAGPDKGTGHVMRCLALAQEWTHKRGYVTFLASGTNEGIRQRLAQPGVEVIALADACSQQEDLEATLGCLEENQASWLALDGYHFGPEYQRQIKEAGYRLLVIDDIASSPHYHADILVNQNLNGRDVNYSTEAYTIRLLGPRYALLRSEFARWREWHRRTPNIVRRVLVTIGGSDPANHTLRMLQALRRLGLEGLEVKAVVGALNPYQAALEAEARQWDTTKVHLLENVADMSPLMAWADLAITAGGITAWEIAFMGLPAIGLITFDNQLAVAPRLAELGVLDALDVRSGPAGNEELDQRLRSLVTDRGRLACMSAGGRGVVDGLGSCRVIRHMEAVEGA